MGEHVMYILIPDSHDGWYFYGSSRLLAFYDIEQAKDKLWDLAMEGISAELEVVKVTKEE